MKKYTAISLSSAILAVGAQAICFCLFLAKFAIQSYLFTYLHATIPTADLSTASQDEAWDDITSIFVYIGVGLAVVSLIAVIISFIKRETGWRFLPVTVLTLYLMTWSAILCVALKQ